ncbi:MAG: hypothetical protein IMZ62_15940 [Chloroflexi bacterium]|nr:hypothetical protein [Chloroflexota bacterium]
MSWQYRVMRRKVGKEYVYGIYEVYSGPKAWTEESMVPESDSLPELRADMKMMGEAFKLPVMDNKTGKVVK